ncbi:MAG: PEP-CTERM sorting domain-containing protein [Myxococcota bacterium]
MISKKWSLVLAAAMMIAPLSASALGISIANVSNTFLLDGETVTIDLVLENVTQEDIFGLEILATGYDVGNDGTAINNHLVLSGGVVASSVFSTAFVPGGVGGVGGLANLRTAPTEQGRRPPFMDPLRTSLFLGAALASSNGDGTLDSGIAGGQTNGGDVHLQVQFTAQAGLTGIDANTVTLNFGTGEFGSAAIGANGQILAFSNASVDITVVPEPGTALLMGLGLAGLAARRR